MHHAAGLNLPPVRGIRMNKQAHEHIKAELEIIMELHRKGELDNFTCGEIAKMAEERINK